MTTPVPPRITRLEGWNAGTDNLSAEFSLVDGALRDVVNTDLAADGKPRRRNGFVRAVAGTRVRSLWCNPGFSHALYADEDALVAMATDTSIVTITTGLVPGAPVSMALAAGRVFWSDGTQTGVVGPDLAARPWGVEGPGGPPVCTATSGAGGLFAGTYLVTVTFLSADGEESGAPQAALVQVPDSGGIALSNIPQPTDGAPIIRLYRSDANGDVMYRAMDIPAGMTTALLGAQPLGRPLDTQYMSRMPAGAIVRWFAGRLWVVSGNTITASEPLRYGLTLLPQNRLTLPGEITMFEGIGDGTPGAGLFVGAGDRTYWLAGANPADFNAALVYPAGRGVVSGTPLKVSGTKLKLDTAADVVYWLANSGVACVGTAGGQVLPLREAQVVAPAADRGATGLVQGAGGLETLVTALQGSSERGVAMGDRLECTVIRHDQ